MTLKRSLGTLVGRVLFSCSCLTFQKGIITQQNEAGCHLGGNKESQNLKPTLISFLMKFHLFSSQCII